MENTQKTSPFEKTRHANRCGKKKNVSAAPIFLSHLPFISNIHYSHSKKNNVTVQAHPEERTNEYEAILKSILTIAKRVLLERLGFEAELEANQKHPHGKASKLRTAKMVNGKSSATKYTQPKKDKRALVYELGFGVFSNLPNYYLKQKVLKQIYKCFDTYDNTIHAVAEEVEITTEKIGKALGLNHTGSIYDEKITPRELSAEDYTAYKFFQGKTQATLSSLIFNTKVDTEENKVLFKRAFLLYIQKCFLFPTSAPNVTPRALPTLFDPENTRNKNWALHVHNFLLEEIEKASKNNAKSVSGCCYALMVIYFHETHFEKNSRDAAA
ncbi:hypothetical protein PIB30_098943 [Stylosanthes scabra]|uniref:Uncharacterized protein n=1 Tax=Stylosanthes scabra TaxID=79078 RepID=A0ABU6SXA5_9FABA|nr:hypothetical protein [Stylosanthes scabra]